MTRLLTITALCLIFAPTALAEDKDPSARPEAVSLGLGGGMSLPQSSGFRGGMSFDVASARLRLADNFTIEPMIKYSSRKDEDDRSSDRSSSSDRDILTTTKIALNTRNRLGDRGAVDLLMLGGVSYQKLAEENNLTEGKSDQTTADATTLSLEWGVGLEGFVNPHWSVGVDAVNPLVSIRNESYKDDDSDNASNLQTLTLSFDPSIRVLSHIYF